MWRQGGDPQEPQLLKNAIIGFAASEDDPAQSGSVEMKHDADVSTFSPQLGLRFLQHRSPAGCVLPIVPYAPGRAPPPHLSPFVGDNAEGYVLRQGEILDDFAQEVGIMGCSRSHARRKQTITRALMTAQK
ncbi:unnamed protein product [Polarella glacialis]|uniref:Uncharacterized protein n=1 Tax=Polarella glacialis TaxID=89957 RepID=A0A813GMC4_POLGL|nr:unnamed protein product [Polarella glacialis]